MFLQVRKLFRRVSRCVVPGRGKQILTAACDHLPRAVMERLDVSIQSAKLKLLASCAEPLPELPMRWSEKRNSRRGFEAICDIPLSISKEELERRIKVFGVGDSAIAPTINLHGFQFRAVLPVEAPG
jgi:hypothetical protein